MTFASFSNLCGVIHVTGPSVGNSLVVLGFDEVDDDGG
jgi:hypothetical protein